MDPPEPADRRVFWSPRLNTLLPLRTVRKTALLSAKLHTADLAHLRFQTPEARAAPDNDEDLAVCSTPNGIDYAPPSTPGDNQSALYEDSQQQSTDGDEPLSLHTIPAEQPETDQSPPDQSSIDQDYCNQSPQDPRYIVASPSANMVPNTLAPIVSAPIELLKDVVRSVRLGASVGRSIDQLILIDEVLEQVLKQFSFESAATESNTTTASLGWPSQNYAQPTHVPLRNQTSTAQSDRMTSFLFATLDSHFHHQAGATALPALVYRADWNDSRFAANPGREEYGQSPDERRELANDEPWDSHELQEPHLSDLTSGGCIPFLLKENSTGVRCPRFFGPHQRGEYSPSPLRHMMRASDLEEVEILSTDSIEGA